MHTAPLQTHDDTPIVALALVQIAASVTPAQVVGVEAHVLFIQRQGVEGMAEASQFPCCVSWLHAVGSVHPPPGLCQAHEKPSCAWELAQLSASVTAAHVVGLGWHVPPIQRQES